MPAAPHPITIHVPRDGGNNVYVSYYTTERKRVRISRGLNKIVGYNARWKAARQLADSIEEQYRQEKPLEHQLDEWVKSRKPFLREKSYYGYRSKIGIFLRFVGERRISKSLITEYFTHRAGFVSSGTLHDDYIYLRRAFAGITDEDFFGHIDIPSANPETKKHYRRRQIVKIKAYLEREDPNLWFACQCVYYLFIRPGSELRLLKVHHFDLDEWRVHIPPSISKNRKNDYVLIPDQFRDDVEDYLEDKLPGDFLFPAKQVSRAGKPIGKNTMMNHYRKHMKALGFGLGYSMYSWKNTGAIACVKAGVHPKILQLQLRHSSLEMTDRYLRRMGLKDMGDLAVKFPGL